MSEREIPLESFRVREIFSLLHSLSPPHVRGEPQPATLRLDFVVRLWRQAMLATHPDKPGGSHERCQHVSSEGTFLRNHIYSFGSFETPGSFESKFIFLTWNEEPADDFIDPDSHPDQPSSRKPDATFRSQSDRQSFKFTYERTSHRRPSCIKCPFFGCRRTFATVEAVDLHIYRDHHRNPEPSRDEEGNVIIKVPPRPSPSSSTSTFNCNVKRFRK